MTREDYDSIPVHFCKRCRSLNIITDPEVGDYCLDCGCTETETALIEQYLKMMETNKKLY